MLFRSDNSRGQLGRSSGDVKRILRISNIPPMLTASCGGYHTLCLDDNGGVWSWGDAGNGRLGTGNTSSRYRPAPIPLLKGMSAVVAGRLHSLTFPQKGGLLVFGFNRNGQLGLNHTNDQTTPTLCLVQPELPQTFIPSRKKNARFL